MVFQCRLEHVGAHITICCAPCCERLVDGSETGEIVGDREEIGEIG